MQSKSLASGLNLILFEFSGNIIAKSTIICSLFIKSNFFGRDNNIWLPKPEIVHLSLLFIGSMMKLYLIFILFNSVWFATWPKENSPSISAKQIINKEVSFVFLKEQSIVFPSKVFKENSSVCTLEILVLFFIFVS